MTNNGTGYKSTFWGACDELGIRHLKTRPYTLKTNGNAERFVQTSLREWAYARPYPAALPASPQLSRIAAVNNLLELDS